MQKNSRRRLSRSNDRDATEGDLWLIAALGMTTITAIMVAVLSYGLR